MYFVCVCFVILKKYIETHSCYFIQQINKTNKTNSLIILLYLMNKINIINIVTMSIIQTKKYKLFNKLFNKQIGGVKEKCDFDIKYDNTHIYYLVFGNDKCVPMIVNINVIDKFEYITIDLKNKDLFRNKIKEIFDNCSKNNIMIYCSSDCIIPQMDMYFELINDTFEEYVMKKKNIRLLNVVIVNLTNDIKYLLFKINVDNKRYFKKIINIFSNIESLKNNYLLPYDVKSKLRYNKYRSSVSMPEITYYNYFSSADKKKKINKIKENQTHGISKEIVFKKMEINNAYVLDKTWWYKYYMESPSCLYYRLFQQSGTCWMNAAINLFLLEPHLADLLKNKYNSLDNKLKKYIKGLNYNDVKDKNRPLIDCIYIIIYQLLINKNKPDPTDENIIKNIANKTNLMIQCIDVIDDKKEGGQSEYGVINILDMFELFDKIDVIFMQMYKNTKCLASFKKDKKREGNLHVYMSEKKKITKHLHKYVNFHQKTKTINGKNIDFNSLLLDTTNCFDKDNKKILLNEYILSDLTKKLKNDLLFVIFDKIYNNNVKIENYILIAALITRNENHDILGIKCITDNQYYIYDSHNIIAQTNWNENDYTGYIDKLKKPHSYKFFTSCLVYIRQ